MKFFTTRISIVRKAPRLRYLGGIERAFEPALGAFGWVYLTAPGRLATIEARPLPGDGGVPWVFGTAHGGLVAANPKRNPDSPI
jgi:hypothetical protein